MPSTLDTWGPRAGAVAAALVIFCLSRCRLNPQLMLDPPWGVGFGEAYGFATRTRTRRLNVQFCFGTGFRVCRACSWTTSLAFHCWCANVCLGGALFY